MKQLKKFRNKIQTQKESLSAQDKSISRPLSLNATSGDIEGDIDLVWEPVTGAYTYVVQMSSDYKTPVKWINKDIVSRSSYTVPKLKSKHKYWFRVAAVGSKGQSLWSDPVWKKAP